MSTLDQQIKELADQLRQQGWLVALQMTPPSEYGLLGTPSPPLYAREHCSRCGLDIAKNAQAGHVCTAANCPTQLRSGNDRRR